MKLDLDLLVQHNYIYSKKRKNEKNNISFHKETNGYDDQKIDGITSFG